MVGVVPGGVGGRWEVEGMTLLGRGVWSNANFFSRVPTVGRQLQSSQSMTRNSTGRLVDAPNSGESRQGNVCLDLRHQNVSARCAASLEFSEVFFSKWFRKIVR